MSKRTFQKRFKVTKTGKIIRRHSNLGHNKAKKNSKIKRQNKKLVITKSIGNKDLLRNLH